MSEDQPRISVVMPVLRADHLSEALASVRSAADGRIELIVVDDGSPDPVEQIVRGLWPEARVVTQANRGPSAARNRGLSEAGGNLIAFLDADDRFVPGSLAALAGLLRAAPGAGAAQGLVRSFGDAGNNGRDYPGYNVGSLLFRRQLLEDVGGFDERLRHSEDVDLLMRLQDRGAQRVLIARPVLEYRRHDGSLTAGLSGKAAASHWLRLLHDRRTRSAPDAVAVSAAPAFCGSDVSVVVVVRNGRPFLPEALASIRRQSLAPIEILAVAGPSDDGTSEYLAGQADVRLIHQHGEGHAAARNLAIAEARGTFIAFHDVDDLWHPEKLARQCAALAPVAQPAACITQFRLEGSVPEGKDALPQPGWTPSALLVHREVLDRVGPFDPSLGVGCDSDWFRRLRLLQIPCVLVPQPDLTKRVHGANLSSDVPRNREAMFRMLRKHRTEQQPDT